MTDILLPPQTIIARSRIRYIDSTGVSVGTYTGLTRTASLGGDRIGATLEFTITGGLSADGKADRAALIAFIASMRGRQNRVYLSDASYRRQGTFPTGELLANNSFASGLTSWSASSANLTLKASNRVLRSIRTNVGADETIRAASVTVVNGASYVARAMVVAGKGAMDFRARVGSTAGGSDIATEGADHTADGLATVYGTTGGTTAHFSVLDGNSGRSIGDYMDVPYASLSRCPLVSGAGQTGSALNINGLVVSTDDQIAAGDQFEVITSRGSELKIAIAPAHGDASGAGYLKFAPALRGTISTGSPIILHNPMSRFVFKGQLAEWSNEPGVFTQLSMDLEEAQ